MSTAVPGCWAMILLVASMPSTTGMSTSVRTTSRRPRQARRDGPLHRQATAKIKAKHDDGRIATEFEVDQNRNGVAWKATIRRNGVRVASTTATTRAPSGSFTVERRIANAAGPDKITARAKSPSGQVCTASVTV